MVAIGVGERFANRERAAAVVRAGERERPHVSRARPADGEVDVLPNASIVIDLAWPDVAGLASSACGVDPATMVAGARLVDAHGAVVKTHANTSAAGDSIVLVPTHALIAGATYRVDVTRELHDVRGGTFAPFALTFTVSAHAATASLNAAFERVSVDVPSIGPCTALTIGPDDRLYAATIDGRIVRYEIDPRDGTLSRPMTIEALMLAHAGPRLITGIAFEPSAPAGRPRLWVSHAELAPFVNGQMSGATEWSGAIGVLEGTSLDQYRDAVVGLPRAFKDHMNFQPSFGPDGALYFDQGSHTSSGAPDTKWGLRPERTLSAAVLRLDVAKLGSRVIDVRTIEDGGTYDPTSREAPLTIYASGVRSAYDMLWHSSGRLYASVNGSAAGGATVGRSPQDGLPGVAPIRSLHMATDDVLIEVMRGRYYGAPNPSRSDAILNGGNPTDGVDPYEVSEYPVGTRPEPNWQRPTMSYGKSISPNGMLEYRGDAFGGALRGAIFVARYSAGDDIIALRVDAGGNVVDEVVGISGLTGLADPLDLVEDRRNGNVYVSEFGAARITLLRPRAGAVSDVYVRDVR